MKKRFLKDDQGFSLIELIVAVLIISIISGGVIVTFNSIFSTEATAAGKNVVNTLKQARAYALGKENKEDTTTKRTEVFARFYYVGDSLQVDVCRRDGFDPADTDYTVLHSQTISNEAFKVKFYKVNGTGETELFSSMDSDDDVKIYFKKSTGGVSVAERNSAAAPDGLQTTVNKIRVYRASATSSYQDITLVDITGRCYIDV